MRRHLRILWLSALICVACRAGAQVASQHQYLNVNTTPRIRVGQILPERNAKVSIHTRVSGDQLGGAGTVVPSFTKDVISTKDTFFKRASTGILRVPKIGGTQGKLRTSALLGPTYRLPLFTWEGAPDDAELKIGRFYLDILTLSGTVLYSDNTEQEEEKTDGEALSMFRLQSVAMLQLTETMRLSFGSTLVYLPFREELGFADPLADLTFGLQPVFLTQLDYEIPLGKNTTLSILDSFTGQSGGFGTSQSFSLLQRDPRQLDDVEGRRSLIQVEARDDSRRTFRDGISYRNVVQTSVSSIVPTHTRLTVGYIHDNLWFDSVNSGQPRSSDNFTFLAENIRENMRFKPRINYSARHQNNRHGYDQNITAGFRGPVSDYIEINADAGAFLSGASDQRSAIYQFGILHEPRESTTHSLFIQRSQVFPSAQLVTQLSYRLQQVLSPEPIRTMRLGARKISWKAGFRCGSRPGCVRLPGFLGPIKAIGEAARCRWISTPLGLKRSTSTRRDLSHRFSINSRNETPTGYSTATTRTFLLTL
jgi:hypothetical protein